MVLKLYFCYSPLCVCVCVCVYDVWPQALACSPALHYSIEQQLIIIIIIIQYLPLRQFCYVKIVFKISVN